MTSLKTPLRYPGGKSRAIKKMAPYLPDMKQFKEYREPFLGGGSFAIWMTQTYPHLDIWVNDRYEPLYNFWCELRDNGKKMRDELVQLKYKYCTPGSAKVLFLEAKEYLKNETRRTEPFHRAVSFYVINKCSFSGLTESSSFSSSASESNFSMRGIDKLPHYSMLIKDWKITNHSYEKLLTDNRDSFTYLDPPYAIKSNLYGRKGDMHKCFDHTAFAHDCDRYIGPQLISYNSDQLIKDRFRGYEVSEYDLTYTMRSVGSYMTDQQKRKELLLLNYGN